MTTVDILDLLGEVLAPMIDDTRRTRFEISDTMVTIAERLVTIADTLEAGSERWAQMHAVAMGLAEVARLEGDADVPT